MKLKSRRAAILIFSVLIFVFGYIALLFLNRPFLANPPYGNDITALHRQAIWLAQNDFDVVGLWAADQVFPEGGANAYPFGIMPYVYGILYSLLPAPTVHLIGHALNTAFLVAAFAIGFYLIARLTGRMLPAFLWSLAALADPVIQGRSAGLGHESLLLLFIMIWLLAVYKRRRFLIFGLPVFMCFIKMSALVVFVALIGWLVILRQTDAAAPKRSRSLVLCGILFAVTLILYGVTAAMDRLNFLIPPRVLWNNLRMLHYIDAATNYRANDCLPQGFPTAFSHQVATGRNHRV